MPFINVKVGGALDEAHVERLQRDVTALMADVLGKVAELTAVHVERVGSGSWSVGAERVPVAAHLDATVTAGSNTTTQKARFIAAAHALLREFLGPELPVASDVVVTEVPGDSWGYSGQTQASRASA